MAVFFLTALCVFQNFKSRASSLEVLGGSSANFPGRLGSEMSSSAERANASAEEEVISLEREIEETKSR